MGIGQTISNCDQHYEISDLCESGWCLKHGFLRTHGTCTTAPMSNHVSPHICTADSDCVGSSTSATYEGSCECGYNPYGNAYCTEFPGDPAGLSFLNAMQFFVASGELARCNTNRRWSGECWSITNSEAYKNMQAALDYFNYYYLYVENDDCIKTTFTRKYWEDDLWAAWLVLPLVMLLA